MITEKIFDASTKMCKGFPKIEKLGAVSVVPTETSFSGRAVSHGVPVTVASIPLVHLCQNLIQMGGFVIGLAIFRWDEPVADIPCDVIEIGGFRDGMAVFSVVAENGVVSAVGIDQADILVFRDLGIRQKLVQMLQFHLLFRTAVPSEEKERPEIPVLGGVEPDINFRSDKADLFPIPIIVF